MTDQNTAYRTDHETIADDDPLAELARIVSGDPSPEQAPDQAFGKAEPALQEAAAQTSAPKAVATSPEFDIEAELMRELDEAEPHPAVQVSEVPAREPIAPQVAQSVATPTEPQALSLEDQLMAELGGESDEVAVDPVSTIENVAESFRQEIPQPNANIEMVQPEPIATEQPSDQVEDFFSDNFEEMLGEEPLEQQAPLIADQAAAIADQEPLAANDDLDLADLDFGEALSTELDQQQFVEPQTDQISDVKLENEFADAFASELDFGADPKPAQPAPTHDPYVDAAPMTAAPLGAELGGNDRDFGTGSNAEQPVPAATNSSKGFKMAIGALSAALVIGLGVVGWGSMRGDGGTANSEPVIIKADAEPSKVKPEKPGGKKIANQDNQVYDRVAGNTTDETPQETLIANNETTPIVETKANNRLSPDAMPAAEQSTLGISPKRVKTFTVKPDGTIIASSPKTPAPTAINVATSQNSTPTQIADATPVSVESSVSVADTTLVSIDGAKTTGSIGIPAPSPLPAAKQMVSAAPVVKPQPVAKAAAPKPVVQPKPVATAPAKDPNAPTQIASLEKQDQAPVPKATSSEWKIQVSSQRSRDAAEASFNNLRRKFGSLLGDRSANIQRANIEGKGTFFRVKVLAQSKSDAASLCTKLKSAGASCFVTR